MATKEGDLITNPVRLRFAPTNTPDAQSGIRVFKNQKSGMYVQDFNGIYYRCTNWRTSLGEPVWAQVDENGANLENYSIYVNWDGQSGGSKGQKIKLYNDPALVARRKEGQPAYRTSLRGFYFFQKLSIEEMSKIVGEPSYDKQTFFADEINDIDDHPSVIARSIQALNEKYDYMREDTNGKFGPGGAPWSNDPDYLKLINEQKRIAALANSGRNLQALNEQIDSELMNSGTAAAYAKLTAKTGTSAGGITTGSSSKTKGGQSKKTKGKPIPSSTTTVILKPDQKTYTGSNNFDMPYMKQIINHFNAADNARQRIERVHVFDMVPNSFEFSQLSSTWNEVARSGNYPLVDWSNYNLTKVSFRFLVVAQRLEVNQFYKDDKRTQLVKQTSSYVNDGLLVSIDEQLENIRAMAGAPTPVTLYNLNTLMTTQFRYPYINNTRNIQWIIADTSITATRLTENGKGVSAAEVSITLTEYPVIAREIIPLPPLTPDNPPPPPCKPDSGDPKCTPADPSYGLWVENTYKFLGYATDNIAYPAGKSG